MHHAVFLYTRFLLTAHFHGACVGVLLSGFVCESVLLPRLCDIIVCVAGLLSRADLPCLQYAAFSSLFYVNSLRSAS